MDTLIQVGSIPDPSLCDALIGLSKVLGFNETDRRCKACGTKVKRCEEVSFDWMVAPRVHEEVEELRVVLDQALGEYDRSYPEMKLRPHGVDFRDDKWNIQHYRPKEGYPFWHSEWSPAIGSDKRFLVWMLYLNSVPGAGTEWLYQDFTSEAEKGKLVIWPASASHVHRGIVSNTDEKWIATGWMSSHEIE